MLFVSDLDNTLIYSYKHYDQGVCVEVKDGKKLSFMTPLAYELLQEVARSTTFVPMTTRSLEQYQRIKLLKKGEPSYAVTSNGAIFLVDGQVDSLWQTETAQLIAGSKGELAKALVLLGQDQGITLEARLVDEAFVYCKSHDVAASMVDLAQKLDLSQVTLAHHKEKLYVLPHSLTKGQAIQRLKKRLDCQWVMAAGDSAFDLSMLKVADLALIPQDSVIAKALADHPQCLSSHLPREGFGEMVLTEALRKGNESKTS